MKVNLESTDRIVELQTPTGKVPARVWEGTTERGVRCYALVTRIAVHKDDDSSEFDRDLQEHKAPSARAMQVFDPRMVI